MSTSSSSYWLLLEVAVFLYVSVYLTKTYFKSSKQLSNFVGPKGLPFIGNMFDVVVPTHEILGVMSGWVHEFGPLVLGLLLNQAYLTVADASGAEKILSSNVHIEKSEDYRFFEGWLGSGLLTSKGQKWHTRRKLLTPAFHFKILDNFIEIFNEQSSTLVDILNDETGNAFDICPYVTRCTLDIICESAMGERIQAQRNKESEYAKAVDEMTKLIAMRSTRPWLRIDFINNLINGKREKEYLKILHGFTERVIQQRKSDFQHCNLVSPNKEISQKRRLAFLDLLLHASENGTQLSDLDIRGETDTFMFAGHDTTAVSITWTILLLAANPQCQRKVREELKEIFGSENRGITTADLCRMKYLECCIKESLRLYPSVPLFARQLTQDLDFGNASVAPKGTIVFVVPYLIHRNDKVFPDPETFLPERFFPENLSWKEPFNYIPFSAGARNCIGQKFAMMEEKVVLAHIFRSFHIENVDRREDIKAAPDVVLRPKDGINVRLIKLD